MTKAGRNGPCPCGSGRKYKNCCWAADRRAEADALDELEDDEVLQWFGYDASIGTQPYIGLPDHGMVCMAWFISADALFEERILDGKGFKVGDWALSVGEHQGTIVHGPFSTLDDALAFGRSHAGAERFLAAPVFEGFE